MKKNFVDCFMLMGTALSLKNAQNLPEMSRPLLQDVFTTLVNVSLTVQNFYVHPTSMNAELVTLINQKWIDPRLGANVKTRRMAVAGQIWKPKITNTNGMNELCNNEDSVFWRGFGNEGNVLLSEKMKLKVACTKHFRRYPFDTQGCEFNFGSYRFPNDEVSLSWDLSPVELAINPDSNEFQIVNVTTFHEIDIRSSGNFSVLVVQFILQRHSSHHVQCIVLPCLLLTLLNYISFYLDLNNRTTRLHLNLLVFGLLLCYYYISVCLTQPTPYLKATDIFVIISALFSVVTLIETLFIDGMCAEEENRFHLRKVACSKEYPKLVYWLEFALRMCYPIFYTFFLILYSITFVK